MSRIDRDAIERHYPRQAHDEDAAENARPKATVHHGVRIVLAPEKPGGFEIARASRQVGEADGQDAWFLFPVRVVPDATSTGYEPPQPRPHSEPSEDAYSVFVSRVLEAAASADSPGPIGAGEERLKGFHGG